MESPLPIGRAKRGVGPRRRFVPEVSGLEARVLLSGGYDPTAEEQYMLELINRARTDPSAEGRRLLALAQVDPVLRGATSSGDLDRFIQRISAHGPLPPIAFNTRLIEAARQHDAAMLARNCQVHSPGSFLIDPNVARARDGAAYYPAGNGGWSLGENIDAFSANVDRPTLKDYVDYLHEAFLIDWGNPDFGHLENLMAPGDWFDGVHPPYSEIGIGLLANAYPTSDPCADPQNPTKRGVDVGPVLVTQEFAWREGNDAFLTGAFYKDNDRNRFYSPGEGIGSVTIRAVGLNGEGTFQTQTWASGGYALQLPPGTYDVTATGHLPATETTVVTIGVQNVAWEVRVDPGRGIHPALATRPGPAPDPRTMSGRPVPGDFDGDGLTDPATYRAADARWVVERSRLGTMTVRFGKPKVDVPVVGQYDGRGVDEIAVYRPTTGQWSIRRPDGTKWIVRFGLPHVDVPVPGDYDGVGRTEIAVYRPTTGQWLIRRPDGTTRVVTFGRPHVDVPVPGAYDGGRRTEIAVYQAATVRWSIRRPDGSVRVVHFGRSPTDVPVPYDYDGGGRTEIAVYRPTVGQWWIRRADGTARVVPFGRPGVDIPVPGRYDGRTEIAVYRPATAQWLVLGSRPSRFKTSAPAHRVDRGAASAASLSQGPRPYGVRGLEHR